MNKIKAKVISSGETIEVRQVAPGDKYFLDNENNPYTSEELDFNVEQYKPVSTDPDLAALYRNLSLDEYTEKSNQSALKLKKAETELNKTMMKLSFKCQLVTTLIGSHHIYDKDEVIETMEFYSNKIFGQHE